MVSLGLRKPRLATFLLASSMFATGACGLVAEYILSTVSTYILGNSIEQFSIIIALMLLMMGVAGYAQRFLSDERLIDKFIIVEVCLAILAGYAPIAIYASFGFMETHFPLVQYAFVMAIGFLIGFEIPLVLRINGKYAKTLGTNIANVFSPDYIGGFVGAMIWTYILLKRFPLTEISFIMAGVNFAIALVTFSYFLKQRLINNKYLSFALIIITATALAYGFYNNRNWNLNLEQRLYDDEIVFSKTTRHQRIVVTHSRTLDVYRLYLNGNLQFSSADEAIYHEQLVHPVMALAPERRSVLILGGGDGLALREVLKYPEVESILLVDLDPDVTALFSTDRILKSLNGNAFADARVVTVQAGIVSDRNGVSRPLYQETGEDDRNGIPLVDKVADIEVMNIDADKFLREAEGKWDVVIIDLPDPSSIELAKLYSKEFYLKLRRVVADNGMVVVQATSPYHAKESFLGIKRTLEAAGFDTLPYHDNVPSLGDWGWMLGWKEGMARMKVSDQIPSLTFSVPTSYLTPEVFRSALVFGKGSLASKYDDVNTLMNPVILHRYLDESWLVN